MMSDPTHLLLHLALIDSLIPLFSKLELEDPVCGLLLVCDHDPVIAGVNCVSNRHNVPVTPADP